MLRALLNRFFRRPAVRPGKRGFGRGGPDRLQRELFSSFLETSGCLPPQRLDRHDATLRRRRVFRRLGLVTLAAMGTWFVIESAHALSMF